jgi:hypothetical protein
MLRNFKTADNPTPLQVTTIVHQCRMEDCPTPALHLSRLNDTSFERATAQRHCPLLLL